MENDSIRASGGNTLVDVWIEGKLRGISVSRGAIETFLGLPAARAAAMSEDERCEFVRTHLSLVLTAAKSSACAKAIPAADTIVDRSGTARRAGPRRSQRPPRWRAPESRAPGDQRPEVVRAVGERRRGDRRKTERRGPPGGRSKS